jgi:hypothetical protein
LVHRLLVSLFETEAVYVDQWVQEESYHTTLVPAPRERQYLAFESRVFLEAVLSHSVLLVFGVVEQPKWSVRFLSY